MEEITQKIKSGEYGGYCAELGTDNPLVLDCGEKLGPFNIAYQTYGTLNEDKSNAILLCHALTGDQYVCEDNPLTGKGGWWTRMIGPGKPIDTDRYFIICPNMLGGCMGSTSPGSTNPATGKTYGLDFPMLTMWDMVRAQDMLIDHLGIEKLFAILGPSVGGMQAQLWASKMPERMTACILIATAPHHAPQNMGFHEVARQAIMSDLEWHGGNYAAEGTKPRIGLSVARMLTHITYMSEDALQEKFGRMLQDREALSYGFDADFQIESYLRHQGMSFVDRFDANSYLYLTRAANYFDLPSHFGGSLVKAFEDTPVKFCVISFTSDWCFKTSSSREIVNALNANAAELCFAEIDTPLGHDAFLLDVPEYYDVVRGFVESCAVEAGLCDRSDLPEAPSPCKQAADIRVDQKIIGDMVEDNSRVLDIGCGNGELLEYIVCNKKSKGMGIELSVEGVHAGVSRGLSIMHGNADEALPQYPDKSFDYAILGHTLQAMSNPRETLEQLVRIAEHAIVSFPNFGHWRTRFALFFGGRMPVTEAIPYQWYDTPNIHFCTIDDFNALCKELGITVEKSIVLNSSGQPSGAAFGKRANFLGEQAVFLLRKN